jgi:hypothetical protein
VPKESAKDNDRLIDKRWIPSEVPDAQLNDYPWQEPEHDGTTECHKSPGSSPPRDAVTKKCENRCAEEQEPTVMSVAGSKADYR